MIYDNQYFKEKLKYLNKLNDKLLIFFNFTILCEFF